MNLESLESTFQPTDQGGTRFVRNRAPKEVFVFGAGLSIPAGFPSAIHLFSRAWKWRSPKGPNVRYVREICEYFYPGVNVDEEGVDVEDMLGIMQSAEEYDGIRGGGRGYKWRKGYINDAKKQLVRLISLYLWSLHTTDVIKKIDYIRNIVKNRKSDVLYVTFNYDLLVEIALSLERIPFTYAIDRQRPGGVVLLKPHGSINWFYQSETLRYQDWIHENCHFLLKKYYVSKQLFPNFLGENINPSYAIIAPYPAKKIEEEFLKRIWTSFSSAIHATSAVTIIGYSMPKADRIARIVLRRAGPVHSEKRIITVVDPADLQNHFQTYISPSINYVQDYCDNYYG